MCTCRWRWWSFLDDYWRCYVIFLRCLHVQSWWLKLILINWISRKFCFIQLLNRHRRSSHIWCNSNKQTHDALRYKLWIFYCSFCTSKIIKQFDGFEKNLIRKLKDRLWSWNLHRSIKPLARILLFNGWSWMERRKR